MKRTDISYRDIDHPNPMLSDVLRIYEYEDHFMMDLCYFWPLTTGCLKYDHSIRNPLLGLHETIFFSVKPE